MSSQERYAVAREQYRPKTLRLLFVAEAPPAFRVNRMFYFAGLTAQDTLFLEMMKVLYPDVVGFAGGRFQPGFSAKLTRDKKEALLRRFRADGYFLIDACEKPMPDSASTATKTRLMRDALLQLRAWLETLLGDSRRVPILLIGGVTYAVCADALRADGRKVLNTAMINHPARGGQTLFRAKLGDALRLRQRS